eukprot:TRINITY_DN10367_c0_g1_i1.p1 TRINITY_DN10367_c0_g1~~TRINITY_DN10367_c0_g1_i1.p1  ORF type:complete len:617 (-),score=75.36 TRINITY_DN10367_c0_g1_i1:74-1924(-)
MATLRTMLAPFGKSAAHAALVATDFVQVTPLRQPPKLKSFELFELAMDGPSNVILLPSGATADVVVATTSFDCEGMPCRALGPRIVGIQALRESCPVATSTGATATWGAARSDPLIALPPRPCRGTIFGSCGSADLCFFSISLDPFPFPVSFTLSLSFSFLRLLSFSPCFSCSFFSLHIFRCCSLSFSKSFSSFFILSFLSISFSVFLSSSSSVFFGSCSFFFSCAFSFCFCFCFFFLSFSFSFSFSSSFRPSPFVSVSHPFFFVFPSTYFPICCFFSSASSPSSSSSSSFSSTSSVSSPSAVSASVSSSTTSSAADVEEDVKQSVQPSTVTARSLRERFLELEGLGSPESLLEGEEQEDAMSAAVAEVASMARVSGKLSAPFQLAVAESVLSVFVDKWEKRMQGHMEIAKKLVAQIRAQLSFDAEVFDVGDFEQIRSLKQRLGQVDFVVGSLRLTLFEILGDEDDMRTLAKQVCGTETCTEVELCFEYYLQRAEKIKSEAKRQTEDLEDLESLISLVLSRRRLELEKMNLWLGLLGAGTGVGAVLTGAFGMNLLSGLENRRHGFVIACIFITAFSAGVCWGLRRAAKYRMRRRRRRTAPAASAAVAPIFDQVHGP